MGNLPLHWRVFDPATTFLVLLLVGHVCADFLWQTEQVARVKGRKLSALAWHGLLTFLAHLVVLAPLLNGALALSLVFLSVLHTGIDFVRARWENRVRNARGLRAPRLAFFGADQAAHILCILLFWVLYRRWEAGWPGGGFLPAWWDPRFAGGWVIFAGLVFNLKGGTTIVRLLLERFPEMVPPRVSAQAGDPASGQYAMGRVIGTQASVVVGTATGITVALAVFS